MSQGRLQWLTSVALLVFLVVLIPSLDADRALSARDKYYLRLVTDGSG
jgi:hypothetical protein